MKKLLIICLIFLIPCYAIARMVIVGSSLPLIFDDFSTDTSGNYTAILNGITVSGGVAVGTANWDYNYVYHNTSMGSNNHYAQADLYSIDVNKRPGLVVRCNGNGASSTGYFFQVDVDKIYLYSFSGATLTLIGSFTCTWANGDTHILKVRVNGSNFYIWVDGVTSAENPMTDSTYATGSYVGLEWNNSGTPKPTADNFKADTTDANF